MQKGFSALLLLGIVASFAILFIVGVFFAGRINQDTSDEELVACTMDAKMCSDGTYVGRVPPTCEFAPCPGNGEAENGMQNTYSNTQYGFSVTYPNSYQALDDADSLYGWPNAVVLFYKGGQAYDVAIEVWDNTNYQEKYSDVNSLVVHQIGENYLTLADITKDEENQVIINSLVIE